MKRPPSLSTAYMDCDGWLCAREALEGSLPADPALLAEELSSLRTTLALARSSDDPGDVFHRFEDVTWVDPVEGDDWLRWGSWVQERMTEAIADPGTLLPEVADWFGREWRLGEDVPPLVVPPLDDAPRRWPHAADGFAEFFGPHLPSVDPQHQQMRMLTHRTAQWRAALADECDDLLTLDDEVLRATVVALGSSLVPEAPRLRRWLAWMAWRIRTFAWDRRWPGPAGRG